MSIFNEKQIEAMRSGVYICSCCGQRMEFEDEWEETLVCPNCGDSVGVDEYGWDESEEERGFYPKKEEILTDCSE